MAKVVERVDRSLSPAQDEKARQLESEGYVQVRLGRSRQAWALYEEDLRMRQTIQDEEDRPVHKGGPLHMMGFILLFEDKTEDALQHFVQAYIEDTLTVDFGHEEEADTAPAGLFLRDLFHINPVFLREIKRIVHEKKAGGLWKSLRDPLEILKEASERMNVDTRNILSLCSTVPRVPRKVPVGFPGPWEKRVFIGGNYIAHMPILIKIKEIVIRLGYEPVIIDEIDVSGDLIHHHSLMYLHTCKFAIFEITSPGGQLMEVERARDYDIKPLLVCTAAAAGSLSGMIQTIGLKTTTYGDIDRDIPPIVEAYLSGQLAS